MALEGTIKVPAVGPVKKTWALAGLGILGVILGVAYWRHLKAGQAPAAVTKAPAAAAGSSGSGGGGGGDNDGSRDSSTGGGFATNAAWDRAAQTYLEAIGSNPQVVADALGKYLHGDAVTEAQQIVIESAIGAEGEPPVSGPGGFPPNIRVRKGGPGPKPEQVTVPDVLGKTYANAAKIVRQAGLKPEREGPGVIVQERPAAGELVRRGSTVVLFGRNK